MSTGGIGGGRKSANVELNLVPYIDLLSTLICFLLITAVWEQINALSTNAQNNTSSETAAPPADPNRVDLSVSIFLDRIEATAGKDIIKIVNIDGEPDFTTLLTTLNDWKLKWPDRKDVTLHSDSQAIYKNLIKLMDTLNEADFPDVGINTQ